MTVTTNERNHQNLWAKEPTMYMDPNYTVSHNERAELLNGRLAMLGFVAAIVSYACEAGQASREYYTGLRKERQKLVTAVRRSSIAKSANTARVLADS
jgi:hypothetical protein